MDGVSEGLTQNPRAMGLPQQRLAVLKDSSRQSFALGAGQGHCSPWHAGVSRTSIFSALCPGKQDLASVAGV